MAKVFLLACCFQERDKVTVVPVNGNYLLRILIHYLDVVILINSRRRHGAGWKEDI